MCIEPIQLIIGMFLGYIVSAWMDHFLEELYIYLSYREEKLYGKTTIKTECNKDFCISCSSKDNINISEGKPIPKSEINTITPQLADNTESLKDKDIDKLPPVPDKNTTLESEQKNDKNQGQLLSTPVKRFNFFPKDTKVIYNKQVLAKKEVHFPKYSGKYATMKELGIPTEHDQC